jgi:replicative DNA helicase
MNNETKLEEVEEVVLGAILLEQESLYDVVDLLTPEMFNSIPAREVMRSIINLHTEGTAVDMITVTHDLTKRNKRKDVSPHFVASLTNRVASTANLKFHVQILRQNYVKKNIGTIGRKLYGKASDPEQDSADLLFDAEKELSKINDLMNQTHIETMDHTTQSILDRNDKLLQQSDGISGVNTGFEAINKLTGGWQPADSIILAARPGMGKTALALDLARRPALNHQIPVCFFSLEMPKLQLVSRIISQMTAIPVIIECQET